MINALGSYSLNLEQK